MTRQQTERTLDELSDVARRIDPERLKGVPRRTATINMRLTDIDKASIVAAADKAKRSLTDYLITLHYEFERVRTERITVMQPVKKPVMQIVNATPRKSTLSPGTAKKKARFLELIAGGMNNPSALEAMECSRKAVNTIHQWRKLDPDFAAAYQAIRDQRL